MADTHETLVHSTCRLCFNRCPILVQLRDGRPRRVTGDPGARLHRGYTCRRGRSLPELHNDPDRLLRTMRRTAGGGFEAVSSEDAIKDVADRLQEIVNRHGPRSVALYVGTQSVQSVPSYALARSLLTELGSPMLFSANTIDQPGKHVAAGLHGYWMAPAQGFAEPQVALWIGINPLVSYKGIPAGVPRDGINAIHARGGKTIVVDPRRTETAALASLHLQLKPGEDVALVAGLLNVVIAEGLWDRDFVGANVDGLAAVAEAVAPFTPAYVSDRAHVPADDIVTAARWFAQAKRGYAVAGTGASMSAATGTLLEYLVLCLDTLCGHYLRAGEAFPSAAPLSPAPRFKAQAWPPVRSYGYGVALHGSGRTDSLAGLQTADLPDEILSDAADRVRVLFNLGGNPVVAWPDQRRTLAALARLDMLVSFDVRMSQTAKQSTHVFASTMCLEIPGYQTSSSATVGYANGYSGYGEAWAQYTPAVAVPPTGSDLVEEWVVFYEVARRMGLQLSWIGAQPFQIGPPREGVTYPRVDMSRRPTHDEILEMWTSSARVSLAEVKAHPSGSVFPATPPVLVGSKDEGWTGRLDVGASEMMDDLRRLHREPVDTAASSFRLLNRRGLVINSNYHVAKVNKLRFYNPLYMNPADAGRIGVEDGDRVNIASSAGAVDAIVETDRSVAAGTVSMQHCFGDAPENKADVSRIGSPVNRLLSTDTRRDRYTGQPLMSNIEVRITTYADPEGHDLF